MEQYDTHQAPSQQVCLGLGSNLGDRDANLRQAVASLEAEVATLVISLVYDTAPALVTEQPRFHNLVVVGACALDPYALLRFVKRIETDLGRGPGLRYGPRLIDIDILLYGQYVLASPELTIPHARLAERAFALVPLAEVRPDLRHPVLGATMRELAGAVRDQDVRPIGPLFTMGR